MTNDPTATAKVIADAEEKLDMVQFVNFLSTRHVISGKTILQEINSHKESETRSKIITIIKEAAYLHMPHDKDLLDLYTCFIEQ